MKKSADPRLEPAAWRHDGYTLGALRKAIEAQVERLCAAGVIGRQRGRVVDFGSGSAPYRPLFQPHVQEYLAADLAGEPADVSFEPGQAVPLPGGSVQLLASFQVLEHVWDIEWYLAECRRLLAPEGQLLLSTHGTWLYHPHPTDFRRWTRSGLEREIESRGFQIIEVIPVVGPLAWTTQFRAFAYHHVLTRLGPPGRLLSACVCLFMNLRMRLEDRVTPKQLIADNASMYVVRASIRP